MAEFNESFRSYACVGDSITVDILGITFIATIHHDPIYDIDDDDSHNVDQSVTGCDDAQQAKLLEAREAYKHDDWSYCGIMLSSRVGDMENNNIGSLWGIELNYPGSDNAHLTTVANELLDEHHQQFREEIKALLSTI